MRRLFIPLIAISLLCSVVLVLFWPSPPRVKVTETIMEVIYFNSPAKKAEKKKVPLIIPAYHSSPKPIKGIGIGD